MILESIFIWVGGLLLISLGIAGLMSLWFWIYDRIWYNCNISIKALVWHLAGELTERKGNEARRDCKMQLGTKWYTRFRGKRYEWECINVEKIKK